MSSRLRVRFLWSPVGLRPLALRRKADQPVDQAPVVGVGTRRGGFFGGGILSPPEARTARRDAGGKAHGRATLLARLPPAPRMTGPCRHMCTDIAVRG